MENNNQPKNNDQATRKFDAVPISKDKRTPGSVSNAPTHRYISSGSAQKKTVAAQNGGAPSNASPAGANRAAQPGGSKAVSGARPAPANRAPGNADNKNKSAAQKKKPVKKKSEKSRELRRKYRRRRIVRLFCLLVVAALSVTVSYFTIICVNDILAMNRSTDKVSVSVNDKMTTDEVIDLLAQKELIKNPKFCKLFAQIRGYDNIKYITSVYELQASYGLEKLLISMSKNAASAETVTLSFPEGYNIEQIFEKLETNEVCSSASLRATAREMDFSEEFPFLKQIPNKDQRYYLLEGYLYPDTYEFYIGENAASVIKRFLTNFENHWSEEFDNAAAKMGRSVDDILKIASIIEKEAYGKDQMYKISSVLHNRLNSGSDEFRYLQCDSTSKYISYIPETVLSGDQRILYTKYYDTYQCVGLPAGPVCSPGAQAIKAALDPESTDYYYFRHDVNKKIYLATTKAGHDRNGEEVLRVNARAKNNNG
ncbi:MAG: endolytic transglycosylase MltG [Clostridia bacterium]|nr:endolytic transglycosylase MltG [Clostridia bacterium]